MSLRNKKILMISPQAWGKVYVSKHHYAIELINRGNTVYFLNPIDLVPTERKKAIQIFPSEEHPGLHIIHHRLFFPFAIKFHFIPAFHWLMKFHLKRVLKLLPKDIDVIWSFDLGDFFPFRLLPAALRIFHPVDEPMNDTAIQSARDANIIFSTTTQILDKYTGYQVPRHFIQHGLADEFLKQEPNIHSHRLNIRVGMAGNFTFRYIDWEILKRIFSENPDVIFDLWGPYEAAQSNIGSASNEYIERNINEVKLLRNVNFHGPVAKEKLAESYKSVDAFLICYHHINEKGRGSNFHKVMEFLSTGKVIVSSYITAYANTELFEMETDPYHNNSLPDKFRKVIDNLGKFNSPDLVLERSAFAKNNSYSNQVDRIENILIREGLMHRN